MSVQDRRTGLDRRRLTGAQKAAVLLIVLGQESAPRLLKHLDPDAVSDIARAAATLGPIDRAALESLIEEFSNDFACGAGIVGTIEEAERLAAGSNPPRALAEILGTGTAGVETDIWRKLDEMKEEPVLEILIAEPAQIAAVMLARSSPDRAARFLSLMAAEARQEILSRMLEMRPVRTRVVGLIETAVTELLSAQSGKEEVADAPAVIANIVNRMEPFEIDEIVGHLSNRSPEAARAVLARIFKFDDVTSLDQAARTALFDEIPTERVILALKGANAQVREAVLASLGARARRMVESELASSEPAASRDVSAARRLIVDAALRLAMAGAILLPDRSAPDSVA